jgi:excinuclease ABC subunit A
LRKELDHRLGVLERVGLSYLTLSRLTRTLSGGESQRIEIAQALGARLTDALYVLDEPTVGLHPAESARLVEVLRDLVRAGNTVVVVEHDLDVLDAADWMIDMGPGSGTSGGSVLYSGPPGVRGEGPPSPTAALLRDRSPGARERLREPRGWIRLRDARLHNLRGVDVDVPVGLLLGVCGMSGSGKSTLVADILVPLLLRAGDAARGRRVSSPAGTLLVDAPCRGVRTVDQSPLARSARSIPASYLGAWDGIRALFASLPESRRLGLRPGTFSFNVAGGRCETCRGEGVVTVDMDFMADLELPCEACRGTRFAAFACEPRYRGRSIADVLRLTVDEAMILFAAHPSIARSLHRLSRVGLGYLTLGQPVPTLSGGEAQRLKLARELSLGTRDVLFVLDEPTVGLHGAEVRRLLALLGDLVRAGNTVLVIEHHADVLAACDWLVELGPEGGEAGGRVIAAGPPEVVARTAGSRIARWLLPRLAAGRRSEDRALSGIEAPAG